jgi:hypothetical protein
MEQADVAKLITDTFGAVPTTVELMDFGHASTTYKVDIPDQQLIVRTNTDPSIFCTLPKTWKRCARSASPFLDY